MGKIRILYGQMSEQQLWSRLDAALRELDPDYVWEGRRPHRDRIRSWTEARQVVAELQTRARQSRLGF